MVTLIVAYAVSILLFFLLFHTARVFNRWGQMRMRHRFFYVWTVAFMCVIAGLFVSGLFQSYDRDGAQILTLFFVCNYYVISLQILWRLSHGQMTAVSDAVKHVQEDIRDGVIKNVDQSASLNLSTQELPRIGEGGEHGQNVLLINKSLAEAHKAAEAVITMDDKKEAQPAEANPADSQPTDTQAEDSVASV